MQHKAHFRLRMPLVWEIYSLKNQYNNDTRAGKNDIRVQGWTISFGTIDMQYTTKPIEFVFEKMNRFNAKY